MYGFFYDIPELYVFVFLPFFLVFSLLASRTMAGM